MEQTPSSTRRLLAHHISISSYGSLEHPLPLKPQWQYRGSSALRRMKIAEPPFRECQTCLQRLSERLHVFRKNHPSIPRLFHSRMGKKFVLFLVSCVAISCYHLKSPCEAHSEPEWHWDHNVYDIQQAMTINATHAVQRAQPTHSYSTKRNLLLTQFSGSPVLDAMSSICSRPNRAYARQWGRDYVRYTGSSHKRLERACFDKTYLLSTILTRQAHPENLWPSTVSSSSRVQYDVIVLLPPDAIIADLDSDLLNLFPPDKLLGLASYEHDSTTINDSAFSEVVFFNLRHKYATATVDLWNSLTAPPVTCGAGNDIRLLVDAVGSLVRSDEERDELIANLGLSGKGFVGERSIKTIPQKVPSSKPVMLVSNAAGAKAALQTTADSVCYRFYPRCDVL